MATEESGVGIGGGGFRTTHWSVVLSAGDEGAPGAREALEALCSAYWYPLYAFARHKRYGAEDARDITQGFFASLLERRDLAQLDPRRGRFRSFLLASLEHYIANAEDRSRALKRGGGRTLLSIDLDGASSRYEQTAGRELSPQAVFERAWAVALLEHVLDGLREEYARRDDALLFDTLKGALTAEGDETSRREQAERLGMSEGAVKVAVHRLRARYGTALREAIAGTVATREEVEDEIRALFEALG